MSGTRSPSPKAPATEALIVAHGQPSDPSPAEARLRRLARYVGAQLPHWRIRSATMAMPGEVERQLGRSGATPIVFPVFMANGWFTETALPARLGMPRERILRPLGLDPSLPGFATRELREIAARRGWPIAETDILVASHGSGSGHANPARCTDAFARALSQMSPWRNVRTGYLEQAPLLSAIAASCGPRTICIPFFAADGEHVLDDIPRDLGRGGYRGVLCPSVGSADYVPTLIANALKTAASELIQ